MAQSIPQSDGVYGQQNLASGNNDFNAISFLIQQLLSKMNTATLVSVKSVSPGGRTGPVGFVDVQPLVNQIDGLGQPIPHGTIVNVPYIRIQGGGNALVVDPKVGDVGVCVFCDRDMSAAIASPGSPVNPGSRRKFDMSDGLYFGGWNPVAPTHYVAVDDVGIGLEAASGVLKTHAQDTQMSTGTMEVVATSSASIQAMMLQLISSTTASMSAGASASISAPTVTITAAGGSLTLGGGAGTATATNLNMTATQHLGLNGSTIGMSGSSLSANIGSVVFNVPSFEIDGNLHVSGSIHCTWGGDPIGMKFGGTGVDLSSTGGANCVLCQETVGGAVTVKPIGDLATSIYTGTAPLMVGQGGTGSDLSSTGGANYVLCQETVGGAITVRDIADLAGSSTYTNATPAPITVGGIVLGETFTNQTNEEMWNRLIYPTLFPTLVAPSHGFALTESSIREIGETLDLHFTSTFSRGTISPAYGTSGYRSGLPNAYHYTGTGISASVASTSLSDSETSIAYTVLLGSQSWTSSVSYDVGPQTLDSKGGNYSTPLAAGTTGTTTVSVLGVYPWFATSVAIDTLTKQTLVAMNSAYVQVTMIAEDGVNKQAACFPAAWSTIASLKQYNTLSGSWDTVSLASFTVTDTTETIQGNSIAYKLWTYNGPTIGSRQLRFYA